MLKLTALIATLALTFGLVGSAVADRGPGSSSQAELAGKKGKKKKKCKKGKGKKKRADAAGKKGKKGKGKKCKKGKGGKGKGKPKIVSKTLRGPLTDQPDASVLIVLAGEKSGKRFKPISVTQVWLYDYVVQCDHGPSDPIIGTPIDEVGKIRNGRFSIQERTKDFGNVFEERIEGTVAGGGAKITGQVATERPDNDGKRCSMSSDYTATG